MKYQHFKGGIYEVIGVGIHTENQEELVAYRNQKGELFFRPVSMFFEMVVHEGNLIQRFKPLEENK